MCFSATASYTASALLLLTGIITLQKAKSRQRMLAAIPLLFSVQQFAEGITWQLVVAGHTAQLSSYFYLFFVFIIWPLWVPLAVLRISTTKMEHALLRIPLVSGIVVTCLALVSLAYGLPSTSIRCDSIYYTAPVPSFFYMIGTIAYLIATISPFFIVKKKLFWLMGAVLAISYMVSFIFYYETLPSVWCFFAALLSVLTLLLVG